MTKATFSNRQIAILVFCGCVILGCFAIISYFHGVSHAVHTFEMEYIKTSHTLRTRLKSQRNELSKLSNQMKKKYGKQNCEIMRIENKRGVSEFGGWCKSDSSPNSTHHRIDLPFLKAISSFLALKTVGSFGDGPGLYKRGIDELCEVKSYIAYDGAPFVEDVTEGRVNFLDLTMPQYGLPVFDWVLSFEVGEHIPKEFENIYLDNVARHAREGVILSWAVIGQGGFSHINNKPLEEVVTMMENRDFYLDEEMSNTLRNSATSWWLKDNVRVYLRKDPKSLILDDA